MGLTPHIARETNERIRRCTHLKIISGPNSLEPPFPRSSRLGRQFPSSKPLAKVEEDCYRRLSWLLDANASWVHLHENLPRSVLVNLVAHQRYGIHAQVEAHFGIGVAEVGRCSGNAGRTSIIQSLNNEIIK